MGLGLGLGLGAALGLGTAKALILYIGAIAAFLLSVFWRPDIGLYYLVPLLPMQTARYWVHVYPLGEKLVDVVLLGVLLGLLFHGERPIFVPSKLNKLLGILIVLTYLSLWEGAAYLGGPYPISIDDPRFSDWKNFVEMMGLFFLVAATVRTSKQIGILIALMCISVLMINRTYHSDMSGRDFSQYSDDLREAGPLGYAGENGMGAFQAEFAVFLIGLSACTRKIPYKVVMWGVAATCAYSLIFTFSRAGYLGFLAGIAALGFLKARKWLFVLALTLIVWQSLVPAAVTQRVLMTYGPGQELDSSSQERLSIWQDAMQVVHQDPIFGTGFDTYQFMGRVGPYQDTHNYYVKVLLETGVVGLAVFLTLLWSAGKMTWALFRESKNEFLSGLGCAFLVMLVCAVFVNFFGDRWTYLQVNGFFWVLLGCVARGNTLLQQTSAEPAVEPGGDISLDGQTAGVSHA